MASTRTGSRGTHKPPGPQISSSMHTAHCPFCQTSISLLKVGDNDSNQEVQWLLQLTERETPKWLAAAFVVTKDYGKELQGQCHRIFQM